MAKKLKKKSKHSRVESINKRPTKSLDTGEQRVEMVSATNESLLGKYCNLALIHHTRFEFVFDFIWAIDQHRILASRVITSPRHAKRIYDALRENIEKYENQHGIIHKKKKKMRR